MTTQPDVYTVLRHCKAEPAASEDPNADFHRQLSEDGTAHARRIHKGLRGAFDLVCVSRAVRALQTAEVVVGPKIPRQHFHTITPFYPAESSQQFGLIIEAMGQLHTDLEREPMLSEILASDARTPLTLLCSGAAAYIKAKRLEAEKSRVLVVTHFPFAPVTAALLHYGEMPDSLPDAWETWSEGYGVSFSPGGEITSHEF